MDRLEQYLDQVCRGIGESRPLRQHIRQELREHLLDAVARYRAEGAAEEQAIARALEDFGGSEQMRQELEAMHGHRAMAVVVDTAMQWKERTMKAQWLWTSGAHVVLAAVITLEVLLIAAAITFILPLYLDYGDRGWFEGGQADFNAVVSWGFGFLETLIDASRNWAWWVVPIAAAWGIFEWRCRSENKTMMRLSGMGVIALGLMVVVCLTAAAVTIPLAVLPRMMNARSSEAAVLAEVGRIDTALVELAQATARNEKEETNRQVTSARNALETLAHMGSAAPVLAALRQSQISEMRSAINLAREALPRGFDLSHTSPNHLADAIERFRTAYAQFRPPTTQPARREPGKKM